MIGKKREKKSWEKEYDKLLAEKLELEYQLQELENSYSHEKEQREEILRLHENTRRLKHDMKNHIMVITSHLQDGRIEETKAYLSHVLNELNGIYTYIETGNSVMNYVLNQKLELAYGKGFRVKAEIENLAFAVMESVDFVSLLSNIMDNALEGAKSNDESQPEITVTIVRRRGYDTIQVTNTIPVSVLEENPELRSEKAGEGHGYGVGQIQRIVEKYDGMCRFYEEDSRFCVAAMIPTEHR